MNLPQHIQQAKQILWEELSDYYFSLRTPEEIRHKFKDILEKALLIMHQKTLEEATKKDALQYDSFIRQGLSVGFTDDQVDFLYEKMFLGENVRLNPKD